MKKMVITSVLFICILAGFYYIQTKNTLVLERWQIEKISHPEKIPKAQYARFIAPGFSNLVADMYWLRTIQYIGGNVFWSEYRKYLFEMMDLITELNPYFESPYTIGLLLLPSGNDSMYEDFSEEEKNEHVAKSEILWLKGIKNFCDLEKIDLIFQEKDLARIIEDPIYKNPCRNFKIPHYLAFIYFQYKKDYTQAAQYYKVVSAQDDAPRVAKNLAAIMQGRWGDRNTSVFMFLSLWISQSQEDTSCNKISQDLASIHTQFLQQGRMFTGESMRVIEEARDAELDLRMDDSSPSNQTSCGEFLARAIRELALLYLEEADARYVLDHPEEASAMTPERLFEGWYIDYIPRDYQQEEDFGMVYRYDPELGRFNNELHAIQ